MKRRISPGTARTITTAMTIGGVVIVMIGSAIDNLVAAFIGFLTVICGLVIHIVFYRCPRCGGHLGRDRADFCRHCGYKLESDK